MLNDFPSLQSSFQKFSEIINSLTESAPFRDKNEAFLVLRAVLHTIRDRIPADEAVQLGGALPAILRGFFYEDWDAHHKISNFKSESGFFHQVEIKLKGHENLDLAKMVPAAMKVIFQHIDQGEVKDVIGELPKEVQVLCQ